MRSFLGLCLPQKPTFTCVHSVQFDLELCLLQTSAYLNIIRNQSLRCFLTKLRLSSHSLRIETGRYGNDRVDRSLRICTFCDSQEVEDEFHFVLTCNRYTDLRKRFLQKYYYNRPNMHKFILLLQSSKRKTLLNLCYYLREAFARRTSLKYFSQ